MVRNADYLASQGFHLLPTPRVVGSPVASHRAPPSPARKVLCPSRLLGRWAGSCQGWEGEVCLQSKLLLLPTTSCLPLLDHQSMTHPSLEKISWHNLIWKNISKTLPPEVMLARNSLSSFEVMSARVEPATYLLKNIITFIAFLPGWFPPLWLRLSQAIKIYSDTKAPPIMCHNFWPSLELSSYWTLKLKTTADTFKWNYKIV